MKKIVISIVLMLIAFTLISCNTYATTKTVSFASNITQDEQDFMDLYQDLASASVSIRLNSELTTGLVFKKEDGLLTSTYYAVSASDSDETGDSIVQVYTSPMDQTAGSILQTFNIQDEGMYLLVIRFQTSKDLRVVKLEQIAEPNSFIYSKVFSIGSVLNINYFNFPTTPYFIISGMIEDIIIHGADLNYGQVGSPLYLSETGTLVGINYYVSTKRSDRLEVRLNKALHINQVIELLADYVEED